MKIFFDTEFTGLHIGTTLISIGLVDENGRSFYGEFLGYDSQQVDDWIQENVISHLKFKNENRPHNNYDSKHIECVGYTYHMKRWLSEWLSQYDSVELVSDCCHYDMVLFIDIFGGAFDIPKNVCPACHDINQDIAEYYGISEKEAFDKSREGILEEKSIVIDGNKHNSLYDAKVIKSIYEIMHKR